MTIRHNESDSAQCLCSQCLSFVKARIVEQGGGSFLKKACPTCGESYVKISNHNWFYAGLRDFYFKAITSVRPQKRYILFFTSQCNLRCPVCFLRPHDGTIQEISVDEVEGILQHRGIELVLYGAEPTCSERIFDFIRVIKKYQKEICIYTNGLKLQDFSYLLRLKKAGVTKIILQFDGFSDKAYQFIRGVPLLEIKMKVLDNLRRAAMPVVFDVTVVRGVNEDQLNQIFEYALKNRFVRGITYLAYTLPTKVNPIPNDKAMLGDELIDIFVQANRQKIKREDLFRFQKLLYVIMPLMKRRICLHSQHFVVCRSKGGFSPIGDLFDLVFLEKILDKYIALKSRYPSFIGFLYALLALPGAFANTPLTRNMVTWAKAILLFSVVKKDSHCITDDILEIGFVTGCTPPQMDYRVTNHCVSGWIFKDNAGKLFVKNNCSTLLRKLWK